jgi:hypothetical protein
VWLALRMAAVGETFPGLDVDISGVTASRKRHAFRLSVWTRTAQDAETQMAIGAHIRDIAGSALPSRVSVAFTEHAASLAVGSPLSRGRSPLTAMSSPPMGDLAAAMSRSTSPVNDGVAADPPTPISQRCGFPTLVTTDDHAGNHAGKAAGYSPMGPSCIMSGGFDRSPPGSPVYSHGGVNGGVLYTA